MARRIVSGVYILRCENDERVYIGSSNNIRRRWQSHMGFLRRGNHSNSNLQDAFDRFGAESFSYDVMEECELFELREREQYHLDCKIQAGDPVFNISEYTDCSMRGRCGEQNPFFGRQHNEKTKSLLSQKNKGRKLSDAVRRKMSASKIGKPRLYETGKPKIRVKCIETGEIFESVTHAALAKGRENPSGIFSVLAGRQKKAYGLHWKAMSEEEFQESHKDTPCN
ncbi:group I intron endonuclease [compost metagenome]